VRIKDSGLPGEVHRQSRKIGDIVKAALTLTHFEYGLLT